MNELLEISAVETRGTDSQSLRRAKKQCVLHLITSFDVGGAERQAVELLKGIDRRRFEVRLAALRLEGPLYREVATLFPSVPHFPVQSSLHEGLSNSVMEAMAAGAPVIATAVGGTTELISDSKTGFLAPPANAEALAQRILSVLRNPGWGAQMAARGRKHVLDQFSAKRMVESVERLYDEI